MDDHFYTLSISQLIFFLMETKISFAVIPPFPQHTKNQLPNSLPETIARSPRPEKMRCNYFGTNWFG